MTANFPEQVDIPEVEAFKVLIVNRVLSGLSTYQGRYYGGNRFPNTRYEATHPHHGFHAYVNKEDALRELGISRFAYLSRELVVVKVKLEEVYIKGKDGTHFGRYETDTPEARLEPDVYVARYQTILEEVSE